MQDVVNSLIIEIFLKKPLFWIVIIAGILCCLFYKEIVGKAGEYWTKKELKKYSGVLRKLLKSGEKV